MFSPNPNVSRQKMPASATRSGLQSKTGRRSGAVLTPQRNSTATFSGRNKSLNVSELPSGFGELGPEHILSEYGTPIPVAVTEALTLVPKGASGSAKVDQNGWTSLVCGRKLIVWNFKNVPHNKTGSCYELLLPPSDLSHSADLVVVFVPTSIKSTASCVTVSPDGAVRYWYDISLENSYTELNLGVRGEICTFLTVLQPPESGCVVGTSASTLIHIGISQGQLRHRVLRPPQGMLSGIGRRMSSLFFGGSQNQPTSAGCLPLRQLLAGETLGPQSQSIYALTGGNLQKWAVGSDQEKLLYEGHVDGLFREHLGHCVWKQDPSLLPQFSSWLMDLQLVRDGVMVLGAGVNRRVSNEVYYAIGILHTEGDDMPQSFLSFTVTGHHTLYESENDPLFWYRLLVPNLSSPSVYIYNRQTVACVTEGKSDESPDVVDFQNLGGGCCDGLPLFISNRGHLVKIQETVSEYMASAVEVLSKTASFAKLDTSIAATANSETIARMSMSTERSARLKAAFLASIRDATHQSDAQSIVDDLFPASVESVNETGSLLDSLVVGLSQEMVDDYPASDPRWAESLPSGSASTSVSLILLHQLDDKQKAHELFLCFLKNYGLWDRLSLVGVRGGEMFTRMLLREHAEKIEAAKALRNKHTEYVELVDRAIEMVLSKRQLVPFNSLTPQDLFYREVSQIHEIIPCLVACEEEQLRSETNPRNIFLLISSVNTILKEMVFAATHYRHARTATYHSKSAFAKEPEFIAWTSSTGPRGMRFVLRHQFDLTVEHGLPEAQNNQEKVALFQQLLNLAEMILDGYRVQLDSLTTVFDISYQADARYIEVLQKFEQERATVIQPFMKHHQYETATSLAEKYCDFETLVRLCDEYDNPERLQMYMEKFKNQGFSEFVFQWHMNAGKRGKLIKAEYLANPSLSRFLNTHENKFMSWLHDISTNNYNQAHLTLLELGQQETQFLARKKTLLSLSKLAALASVEKTDETFPNIEVINSEQDLIQHQEQLMMCDDIRERLAIDDVGTMNVLSVNDQIDLYTCEYNINANEFDFKKALDLMSFIDKTNPDIDCNDILLKIWSRAILRDQWNQPPSATDPIDCCRETVFFKTLDLITSEDGNLEELLPSVDELLESEYLGDLRYRSEFQCLVRAIYEFVNRMAVDESSP